jgi:tetratricopeptide (TPR) repeat protein
MGRLYVERGRWPEAESVLTEGLTRRRALGDEEFHRARLVSSLSRLGMIYSQTQRYHEAEQVAREAASILESLGDQEKYSNTEAYVLQALGLALVLQGNRSEALSTMRRAQTLAQDEELKDTIRQQLEGILAESPDPH